MRKSTAPTAAEMLAQIDRLPIFPAQQLVNGWVRAYGWDAASAAQKELDRRRRKDQECDEK